MDAVSGHPLLVQAAEDGIKRWTFSVGHKNRPSEPVFEMTFDFKLKEATNARHGSKMTYKYPGKVTVTTKAQYVEP